MDDIEDGVRHVMGEGLVDSKRMCVVGWSYGGYAALMSSIRYPDRYRCTVSVAGVADPYSLVGTDGGLGRTFTKTLMPDTPETIQASAPRRRASELKPPVLLLHGDLDINVDVSHSRDLKRALEATGKAVDYTEYEGADHQIGREAQRTDLLRRIGAFLDEHLAEASGE